MATAPKPKTTAPKPKAKTQQQRQAEKRKEKLDLMEQQIKEGSLVVRKMTAAERKKFPAKPRDKTAKRKRR